MMQPLFVTNFAYRSRPPAHRPMPFVPFRPQMEGHKRLGVLGLPGDIGLSLGIAGAGVGAFLLSGILPTPWDLVGKGVGAAAVGYAFYRVLSGPSEEKAPTESGTKFGAVTPIPRLEDFDTIQGSITSPRTYSTLSYNYFTGKYPVEVLLSYPRAGSDEAAKLQKPVTFQMQLEAIETPNYRYTGTGEKVSGIVASEPVTLNPGDQTPIQLKPELITSTFLYQPALSVILNLYKVKAGTPAESKSASRVKMATSTFFLG